jgi:hypothetical protein
MLTPFFTEKMHELLDRVGTPYNGDITLHENLNHTPTGYRVLEKGSPLYMRIGK